MRTTWIVLAVLVLAVPGHATPPGDPVARGLSRGANHHLGDAGFIAAHGYAPGPEDEHARVHDHFTYVRKLLAEHAATKPELAERRAQLLHYFDEYIAKNIEPQNVHVPWRTPVFIDDHGTICAVGYLIEQSAGRALPEKIAASHRYDFIEDIAAAMPDVRDWVASSGFTLEELGSIQPGYEISEIGMWSTWNFVKRPVEDGAYEDHEGAHGAFKDGRMDGEWKVTGDANVLQGRGTFVKGNADWTSFYPDGKTLAEGPFVENVPHGAWTFYHPSGNVAGEGNFKNGYPYGAWSFYYDSPDKQPIAKGTLRGGTAVGRWQHFDTKGAVFAESRDATPKAWKYASGYLLTVVPAADGVRHQVHEGRAGNDSNKRLDMFELEHERIFVEGQDDLVFDDKGNQLVHGGDGTWTSFACSWTAAEKTAAREGKLVKLHGLLDSKSFSHDLPECRDRGSAIPATRVAKIEKMLAPVVEARRQSPEFIKQLARSDGHGATVPDDLADVLARNMSWYIEWPHVHGKIIAVYTTLPGFTTSHAYDDTMNGN